MNFNSRHLFVLAFGFVSACAAQGTTGPTIAQNDEDESALSADACPPDVPDAVAITALPGGGADQRLSFVRYASGTQVYVCNINPAGAYGWLFVQPNATLYRTGSDDITGTHFIGPYWQGNDGSSVKGARVGGATVDPTAIPWLLLSGGSNIGPGKFANVTTIQRLNTVGGIAPAEACDATKAGQIRAVPYTTEYFFYETRAPGRRPNPQCN